MNQWLKLFFNQYGKIQNLTKYSGDMPTLSIATHVAKQWNNNTQPGHGMFFDFSATPELQKPVLDYLVKGFGWKLEKPYFIRKPKH